MGYRYVGEDLDKRLALRNDETINRVIVVAAFPHLLLRLILRLKQGDGNGDAKSNNKIPSSTSATPKRKGGGGSGGGKGTNTSGTWGKHHPNYLLVKNIERNFKVMNTLALLQFNADSLSSVGMYMCKCAAHRETNIGY